MAKGNVAEGKRFYDEHPVGTFLDWRGHYYRIAGPDELTRKFADSMENLIRTPLGLTYPSAAANLLKNNPNWVLIVEEKGEYEVFKTESFRGLEAIRH